MAANSGLEQIIDDRISEYLADPSQFPPELLEWLPQFLTVNSPALQNSDLIGGTFTPVDGAPHNVEWGSGILPFSASATTTVTITHALGDVPAVIIAVASGGESDCNVAVGANDASTIVFDGWLPAAATKNVSFYWLAIS